MTARHTPDALARLAAPLRRLGLGSTAVAGAGGAILALAVAAWLVRLGLIRSPLWVVGAWGAVAVVVAVAVAAVRRTTRQFRDATLARLVEGAPGWRRGAVTAVLEGASAGTSPELFHAADQACAAALGDRGPAALEPVRTAWERRARWAGGVAVVGLALLAGARPGRGPVALLWSPGEAWATFLAPVQVAVDRETVDRGESVAVGIRAAGRADAELWLRGKGETWRSEPIALDSTGRATRTIGPLEGDLFAFVRSGGRTSDTVLVHVRLPAFLGRVTLTARYPRYLKLDDEVLPTSGDTLLLPEGTTLSVAGETTADLAAAAWRLGGERVALEAAGATFRGALQPRRSGLLELDLATADGAPIGGDPIRIPVTVVPDQAPVVEVPVPGQDTMPVLGRDVAMVIDIRDDHGLTAAAIVATRPRSDRPPVVTGLPLTEGASDRALVSTRFDLERFGLAPGDTLWYWVQARDNAPAGNVGRSRTFVLVVPTTVEARAEQRAATREVAKTIDSLVAESKQLQRQTEDLSRERQRGNQADKGDPSLAFEDAKRAEQVAADQQQLMDQAEQLDQQLEELQRSSEKSGLADSSFRRQLDEIREQLDKAISPEMRKRLEELRESLKNLDPQGTKEALKKLSEAQQKLKEALERTRELFKRAALEGELTALEQESKELTQQQEAWNEQVAQRDSSAAAAEEQALAQRADSVAQGLEQASKQVSEERKESLQESSKQAREAAQNMRNAAQSAKSGKKAQAKQQGEQAAKQMEQVQKEVEEQREQQQDEWRQEVMDALDRALAETARLSQRQLNLSNSIGRGSSIAQSRLEQGVIEEGVQKIIEQILSVSGKNALISPQIGAALVQARLQMGRAREAVSSASANIREAAEQAGEAVDALNVAAFQMLRSRDDVSGSSSASGLAEAIQKMQQMAGQQGSMSQEGQNLLSMLAGQQQMQAQLQALAQRQRQMAQDLERLRAETQMPGSRDLAEEARELARKLEAGRIDRETVERQERLFKRMLDAGRTLQGEEKDEKKERESETAKGDSLSIPAPLRRLMDRSGQIRLPGWDELQRLSPDERRLVTDYFRRLAARGGVDR